MSRKNVALSEKFIERLRLLMDVVGFPGRQQTKFAKVIGISHGFLSDIMNMKSGPSAELFSGIATNFPEANIRWLLTGEGTPLTKASDSIIDVHPKIVSLGQYVDPLTDEDVDEYAAVPLVEGRIAAGSGRIVREVIRSYVWIYRPEIGKRNNLVAVRLGLREKSMIPTLMPGSIVIIDRNDKEVSKRGIYAVRTGDDECAVKRVRILNGIILFASDNPDYDPLLAPTTDLDQLIIGRVIWYWKSFL
jgi:phage repressor protein C with HTH and peptisase S24 domain